MKMPSVMGYLDILNPRVGSLSRKWKNMVHSWTSWQNCIATTFLLSKVFGWATVLQTTHCQSKCNENSIFHSLCYAQEDLILTQAFKCCIREKFLQLQCTFRKSIQINCNTIVILCCNLTYLQYIHSEVRGKALVSGTVLCKFRPAQSRFGNCSPSQLFWLLNYISKLVSWADLFL